MVKARPVGEWGDVMDFTGERFVPDAKPGGDLEAEHLLRYHAIAGLATDKVVLDAASGEGYGTAILGQAARQVYGLEIDPVAVAHATRKYQRTNTTFIQGSVNRLPFPEATFDLVVSFETIEHVDSGHQEAFLLEIKRVLRPDGILVMSTPDKRLYSDLPQYHNEYHVKEFYREEFHDFLARRFTAVRFLEQTAVLAYVLATAGEERLRQFMASDRLEGKYIVALCSDAALPSTALGAIVLDREDLYQKKVDRVVALQGEIDVKNGHLFRYEDDIRALNQNARAQEDNAQALHRQLAALHKDLEECRAKADQAQALLAQTTQDKAALHEALQGLRAEVNHIKSTRAWRLVQAAYRFKDKFL